MIVVIIAGGSGTRLWPLSTPDFPKQLLTLTNHRSLLQNTYDRATQLTDKVYVVSEASHVSYVYEQLSEIPKERIVVDPARRNTAACFVAALVRIAKEDPGNDEPIAFMHADHQIRDIDGFVNTVAFAARNAKEQKRIVLLGVEPDHPATGFGYIQKGASLDGDDKSFLYKVSSFKEKPDFATAKSYVDSGHYLWNMGYFVAPASVFAAAMEQNAPQLFENYNALLKTKDKKEYDDTYLGFESVSIDIALLEKMSDLLVVPGSFGWADIGTFADLHASIDLDAQNNHLNGNSIMIDGVENAYIRNDEEKAIAVIGLDNVVVVNTPYGLLVARKDLSSRVGDIAKKLQAESGKN